MVHMALTTGSKSQRRAAGFLDLVGRVRQPRRKLRKAPAGEHADILPLLHDRLCRTFWLCGELRFMNEPVETF
jgi:hypothetical protein